jgi:signal peptidase II
VGFGDARWPTFNVADMAVSVGAVLLAWVLWQEDRALASAGLPPVGAPLAGVAPTDQGDLV